jgi:hypothetical protein
MGLMARPSSGSRYADLTTRTIKTKTGCMLFTAYCPNISTDVRHKSVILMVDLLIFIILFEQEESSNNIELRSN